MSLPEAQETVTAKVMLVIKCQTTKLKCAAWSK